MDRTTLNLVDYLVELLAQLGLAEYDEKAEGYVIQASGEEHLKIITTLLKAAHQLEEYDKAELQGMEERVKDEAWGRLHHIKGKKTVH